MSIAEADPVLRVDGLVKHFPLRRGAVLKKTVGHVRAVDGVSFELHRGETLGLVGESGCGKSTLARTMLRLEEPTAGAAYYKGHNIHELPKRELRALRQEIQIVFQNPHASLDPRMRVGEIIEEAWRIHPSVVPRRERRGRARDLLKTVGLKPDHMNRYPHQLSGGQRQRIGLARALALNPRVIICDEPVSALDVSVQAQVVNLLEEIQQSLGLSLVFIAHDISLVRHVCDRIAVMYLGKIVEIADEREIFDMPVHPYTQALLAAVPIPDPAMRGRKRMITGSEVPDPAELPSGCRFHPRCFKARLKCQEEEPELIDRFEHGHPSACFFADERNLLAN